MSLVGYVSTNLLIDRMGLLILKPKEYAVRAHVVNQKPYETLNKGQDFSEG